MRKTLRASLIAALGLGLALSAQAQIPSFGFVVDAGGANWDIYGNAGEVYGLRAKRNEPNTDWLVDASQKGGPMLGVNPGDIGANAYQLAPNWSRPEGSLMDDTVFAITTYPTPDPMPDLLHIDSNWNNVGINSLGMAAVLPVGDTPSGNFVLPTDGSQGSYDLGAGGGSVMLPGATAMAITVGVGAHPDIDNNDRGGFTWGGEKENPNIAGRGILIGYNVFRRAQAGAPAKADFTAADWVYFLPFSAHDLAADQTPGGGPGTPSPADSGTMGGTVADMDLAGVENIDNMAYTGDELLLLQDGATNPDGSGRAFGAAPTIDGTVYWYAFQPVVEGSIADFVAADVAGNGPMDYAIDTDADGTDDSVDFNTPDGSSVSGDGPEFWSPQAAAGLPGLGLTVAGRPLLSAVVQADTGTLPAGDTFELRAQLRGREGVDLSISAGLEGDVVGYNVFRLAGEERTQVNSEIIAARGGSGGVYGLIDDAAALDRRARAMSYELEVVYADGRTETFGPFQVERVRRDSIRRR